MFFVFCNFYNSHPSHLQIQIYLLNPLKTLYFQGISPILCSNLMYFPLFLPLRAETRESFLLSADHLIQQSCGSTLRFPCSVSVNIHCSEHQKRSQVFICLPHLLLLGGGFFIDQFIINVNFSRCLAVLSGAFVNGDEFD